MKSALGNFKGAVLDVGCGESNKYLGFCPCDAYIGDAAFLPFKDESFDAVICNAVLEHVEKPKEVLKEIYRVAKPRGQCYISVPFLINYHPVPEDFRRYTKVGMKNPAAGRRVSLTI
jgi:ubiquinone/menaquinone biosynthesis C-methylase UbiE